MTYQELDNQKRKKINKLLEECEVFFAFNMKQFKEGKEKYNISAKNKVANIGAGGYVPTKHIKALETGFINIEKWYAKQEKNVRVVIKPKRISEKTYYDMLDVLPPIYHSRGVFQVSEPYNHITVNGKEQATYSTYQKKNERYYSLGILTKEQAETYSKTL